MEHKNKNNLKPNKYRKRKGKLKRHLTNGIRFARPVGRLLAPKNRSRANALYAVFSPPQFGQGSMLRIALLPAQTVVYLER